MFFMHVYFWGSFSSYFDSMNFCVQKDDKSNVREYEGQEVLRVRAYGSSFFTLGINIRYPYLLILLSLYYYR